MTTDPQRLTEMADPPRELLELVRSIDPSPALPPDLGAVVRAGVVNQTVWHAGWVVPGLTIGAVLVGAAAVAYSLLPATTVEPAPPAAPAVESPVQSQPVEPEPEREPEPVLVDEPQAPALEPREAVEVPRPPPPARTPRPRSQQPDRGTAIPSLLDDVVSRSIPRRALEQWAEPRRVDEVEPPADRVTPPGRVYVRTMNGRAAVWHGATRLCPETPCAASLPVGNQTLTLRPLDGSAPRTVRVRVHSGSRSRVMVGLTGRTNRDEDE